MSNIRKYILHIPNDQLNTILTKVQQGESGADDLFCSTLYPDVEKYCEGKVKDQQVAAIIAKQVLQQALCNIHTITSTVELNAYLRRIAYPKCYRYTQTKEKPHDLPSENCDTITKLRSMGFVLPIPEPTPDDIESVLYELIDTLPTSQKNVVKMRLEGYRNVEIAELYKLPRGTVHSQLVYARYKIRKKITEYYSQNR
jgi:RNA polymerase sigma factor (sigma-70 family)